MWFDVYTQPLKQKERKAAASVSSVRQRSLSMQHPMRSRRELLRERKKKGQTRPLWLTVHGHSQCRSPAYLCFCSSQMCTVSLRCVVCVCVMPLLRTHLPALSLSLSLPHSLIVIYAAAFAIKEREREREKGSSCRHYSFNVYALRVVFVRLIYLSLCAREPVLPPLH